MVLVEGQVDSLFQKLEVILAHDVKAIFAKIDVLRELTWLWLVLEELPPLIVERTSRVNDAPKGPPLKLGDEAYFLLWVVLDEVILLLDHTIPVH